MAAGTFSVTMDPHELVGVDPDASGKLTIRFQGGATHATVAGDLVALDEFSRRAPYAVSVSAGYTVELPTDVASGGDPDDSAVGYDLTWFNGDATVRALFVGQPDGSTVLLSDLAPMENIPVAASQGYALQAENSAAAAAASAAAAATFDPDNFAAAAEVDVSKHASPQAAVTAAQALGTPVIVKFDKGTYSLSSAVNVTGSDIVLDLGKAKLVPTHSGVAVTFTGSSGTHLTRSGIRGGHIDLNSVGASAVTFTYCDDPFVSDVRVSNGATNSGLGVGFNNCTGGVIRGVRASTIGSGVSLDASPRATVTGCVFTSLKRDGVLVYNGSHRASIVGNEVYGYDTSGESGRAGIHAYGSDYVTVSGNTVDLAGVTPSNDSPKIRFRDALSFSCTGNVVSGLGSGGITVIALADIGSGAGKGTIVGNTIRDVSATGVQTAIAGSATAAALFPVTVAGNTIMGVRVTGTLHGDAIQLAVGTDACAVSGNYIEDCDGTGILNNGAAATITGNTIRQIGKGSLGTKTAIVVVAGTSVVVGNYVYDDAGVATMTNALRVFSGAVARTAGNLFQNATSANVRNDGTVESQLGDINTAKLGFYGTTPIVRPASTPAAATDAATTQTLVNDLRTKLLALGLIS